MSVSAQALRTQVAGLESLVARALVPSAPVGVATTTFVWRPGEPAPKGNVYADWNALYTQFSINEGPKIVQIQDTIITPAVFPPGAYDMRDCALIGNFETIPPGQLTFAEVPTGTTLNNLGELRDQLVLTTTSSAPVHTMVNNDLMIIWRGAKISAAPGATPYFLVPPGVSGQVVCLQGGVLGDTPARHVADIALGASLTVILDFAAGMQNDVLTGLGQATVAVTSQSAFLNTPFPLVQPALASFNLFVYSFGEFTFFQNLNPVNWVNPPPTTVAEAVDRMAALLTTLNGGNPIP